MSGHDEDNNDPFDSLLDELERAADSLGSRPDEPNQEFVLTHTVELFEDSTPSSASGPAFLQEQPKSLVDLRALNFDQPLSHDPPRVSDERVRPAVGAVVDQKYEILAEAQRSTEGYEAKHVVLRQKFILQLLSPVIVDDPMMWSQFQSDIRAAGLLGHEHLEFVTDLGRCPTFGAYLVKQWIEGPTLTEYLARAGKRPLHEAVQFAHSVGGAIAALHEVGIIHGRLSPGTVRRVEGAEGAIWKVLDVCIPGGDEVLVAPEQIRGEATGPEADQYAVALLARQMITGGHAAVSDVEEALPAPLSEVLSTAMADHPLQRYADMEAMLKALLDAAPSRVEPTVDPFDRREATRNVRRQLEKEPSDVEPATPPAPNVAKQEFGERPRSMLVSLDRSKSMPVIAVDFATRARLRREYRRNILAGGLFVPTADTLPLSTPARVELRFPLSEASVQVDAMVVSFDAGSQSRPRGYGVAFDARARSAIEAFIESLETPDVTPNSKLTVKRQLDKNAKVGAGEAFLLSRLGAGITVGSARAMFSGLPYDFDACLATLIEGGWIGVENEKPTGAGPAAGRVERERAPAAPSVASPVPPPAASSAPPAKPAPRSPHTFAAHEWEDVERVLETVDYFEEQGNFMAAGRVLESASQNAPGVAVYLNRLGLLRARFDMNLDAARTAIRQARAIAPREEEYQASERYIATLIEMSAVRLLWEHDFTDEGSVRWIRSEPDLGRVWLALEGRSQRTLLDVDYRTPRTDRETKSTSHVIVPENSPEFETLEHRSKVDLRSAVRRHERQIELARRFGKLGPHFVRSPAPAARSTNSTFAATIQGDLIVDRTGAEPLRLGSGDIQEVRFSPDDQTLAWVAREVGERWSLHISPVTGPASRRGTFEARPAFVWTDDSGGVAVLEKRPGQLRYIDRRVGHDRLLCEMSGFVDLVLLTSSDGMSTLVVGRRVVGDKNWVARWVDLRTGDTRGEYVLPDGVTDGLLRSDGKLAATLRDGRLFLANFQAGTQKTVSTVSAAPGSLRGSWWKEASPLILVELLGAHARVLSIDVDLLCG